MYKIIGADKKEYGPVTTAQLHQWISEGRANSQTLVQAVGTTDWKPLGAFPEFADALRVHLEPIPLPQYGQPPTGEPVLATADYELDLGGCISAGWSVVKVNFGTLFGGVMIYFLIEICISATRSIPVLGILGQAANFILAGPLMGGLFYLFLQTVRGEPSDVGMVFSGFSRAFLQLFLGYIVAALLLFACMIPAIVVGIIEFMELFKSIGTAVSAESALENFHPTGAQALITLAVGLVCLIPAIYLQVCWQFSLPLIIDQKMDFWPAMQLSRRRVSMHWWQVFGLIILIGLLNVGGVLVCCVGVLVTMPIGFAALMIAYETIFFGKAQRN